MSSDITTLPDDIEALKKIILKQRQEAQVLSEKISILQTQLFARKSEKLNAIEEKQSLLFNEIESIHDSHPELPLTESGEVTVQGHKRSTKRKSIPDDLPRKEQVIEPPESEKVCGCGTEKSKIGEEVSEKIDYIPAKAFVRKIIRPKYACRKCKGSEDEGQPVAIAPMPPSVLGRSILSEGLFGHILVSKFCDSLPFYRQESILQRAGIDITRKVMAATAIRVAEQLKPLQQHLLNEIKKAPVIGIDETPFQVLKEKGRRAEQISYLWHFRAFTADGPIPLYLYKPYRSGKFLTEMLGDFHGSIMTDGYRGYTLPGSMPGITHAGCNAHARRKFIQANQVSKNNPGTRKCIKYYAELYKIESDWKKSGKDLSELGKLRDTESRRIMNEFHEFLSMLNPELNPSSNLSKAVTYTLNEWPKLTRFLDDPEIHIDNNAVENGIRPFVIGRKNWLFADTESGAHASAMFYTLIEGAKAAGLDQYLYMSYLLYHAARAITDADWCALLPMNLKGQDLTLPE